MIKYMKGNVVGVYENKIPVPFGDCELQKRLVESCTEGFKKIGYTSLGNYYIKDFNFPDNVDIVISCGPHNKERHDIFDKYQHVIWLNVNDFSSLSINNLDSQIVSLQLTDLHYNFNLYYYPDLPDDRIKKFGIILKDRSVDNGQFIIVYTTGKRRISQDAQEQFYKNAFKFCIFNNINFKLCFHPTDSQEEIDKCLLEYQRYGKFEYSIGAKNELGKCKAAILNTGKMVFECLVNDVPFYSLSNYTNVINNSSQKTFTEFIMNPLKISHENRQQFLNWVSYQNWTENELLSGEAQSFLVDFWNGKIINYHD